MRENETDPCFRCGEPSEDITSKGGYVEGGYSSKYDCETHIWITPMGSQNPEGELCNACMAMLLAEKKVERIYLLGKQEEILSAAAHSALFRAGSAWISEKVETAKAFENSDEGLRWLIQNAVPFERENAHLAGMLFVLASAAFGKPVDLAHSENYGTAMEKHRREEREFFETVFSEMEAQGKSSIKESEREEAPYGHRTH